MNDGLGELRSYVMFVVAIFIKEFMVRMWFVFFQIMVPIIIGVFDIKIKNGRIPCRVLS